MLKTHDDLMVDFMAEVQKLASDLPPAVMYGLMKHPGIIRRALPLWHPWHNQEILTFECSSQHREESLLGQVRRDIYLARYGARAFEAAFAIVPMHVGKVSTVRVKLHQLGLTESCTQRTMRKRAYEFGLGTCPLFVVYHYRLRYKDQPLNEMLYISTDPVDIGDGEYSLFRLSNQNMKDFDETRYNKLWLDGCYGEDDFKYDPDSEWVFALRG